MKNQLKLLVLTAATLSENEILSAMDEALREFAKNRSEEWRNRLSIAGFTFAMKTVLAQKKKLSPDADESEIMELMMKDIDLQERSFKFLNPEQN